MIYVDQVNLGDLPDKIAWRHIMEDNRKYFIRNACKTVTETFCHQVVGG